MIEFDKSFSTVDGVLEITKNRKPKFDNILKILKGEAPDRPTLFEFFMNETLYESLTGENCPDYDEFTAHVKFLAKAFGAAGYDYVTIPAPPGFGFQQHSHVTKSTVSLNDLAMIRDDDSFKSYAWPNINRVDFSYYDKLRDLLPEGMKAIVCSPGGVLENAIALMGFDNICFHLIDNPELVENTFNKIGSLLLDYYKVCTKYECIGACIVNDDWGFNSQTMLSPPDMRKHVIPWHKKIVKVIHDSGRPAILHSCGQLDEVMDDIIDDIGFDGKHSYEDKICPVEEAYEIYHDRIAVMGGIDMDYVCRKTPEEVYARSSKMLERSNIRGGYGLGTGNSVPEYVPMTNYYSMISAALRNK